MHWTTVALASLILGLIWTRFKLWRVTTVPYHFLERQISLVCNNKEPDHPPDPFRKRYSEPVDLALAGFQIVFWPLWLAGCIYFNAILFALYLLAVLFFKVLGGLFHCMGAFIAPKEQQHRISS